MKLQTFLLFLAGVASTIHNTDARLSAPDNKKTGQDKRVLGRGNKEGLTVMTRNLYLGADIMSLLSVQNNLDLLVGVTNIWREAVASNFELRMDAIADEIQKTGADIVGLQEAYQFSVIDATGVAFTVDLAKVLLEKLEHRGLHYSIKASNQNGLFQAPMLPIVGDALTPHCDAAKLIPATSSVPIDFCLIQSVDFDVTIVNDKAEDIKVTATAFGTYTAQDVATLPSGTQDPKRGWSYFEGAKGDRRFRFVNTHLEVADTFNQDQANELFMAGGPLYNVPEGTSVILLGDFNSAADMVDPVPENRSKFGSTAVENILTSSVDLKDAWEATPGGGSQQGYTFGQLYALDNRKDLSYARIDLIFFGPGFRVKPGSVGVVGQRSLSQSSLPYWASDHSGVVATVLFD